MRTITRLTTGGAAGVLALGVAVGVPAGTAFAASGSDDVNTIEELRDAIAAANANPGPDRIELTADVRFAQDGSGSDMDGAEAGDLDVTDDLRIDGNGFSIDARALDRVFDVAAGATLRLDRITLTGGKPAEGASGGAVRSAGTLVIDRSVLRGNMVSGAGASGGALFNAGGDLRVERSTMRDNSATRAGGAIEANAGRTIVSRSTLADNRTGAGPGNGGALHLTGAGEVRIERSQVTGNAAAAEGGGLWNSSGGTFVITRSSVAGNTAAGDDPDQGGGGLYNDGGMMTVERTQVRTNTASGVSGSGGGVLNNGGTLRAERSNFAANSSQRAGGGIETNGGAVTLQRVDLEDNRTGANPGNGGGLHVTADARVDYNRGSVTGNAAANEGGGLWNSATGTIIAERVAVRGNTAPEGPNVYNNPPGGTFVLNGQPVPAGDNDISTR